MMEHRVVLEVLSSNTIRPQEVVFPMRATIHRALGGNAIVNIFGPVRIRLPGDTFSTR
jgi:hypothetical protein